MVDGESNGNRESGGNDDDYEWVGTAPRIPSHSAHANTLGLTIEKNDARCLREAKRLNPTDFDIEILRAAWPPHHRHVMEALAAIRIQLMSSSTA